MSRRLVVALSAAALVLAGGAVGAAVGFSGNGSGPLDLRVTGSQAGPMVVTASGSTVYVYLPDPTHPPASTCTADCANDWPPVLALPGRIHVHGVAAAAVGIVVRAGGGRQLTLAGYPLYRFAGDQRPGDTYGESIGNTWFAVAPDGSFLGLAPASFHGLAGTSASGLRSEATPAGSLLADGAGQTLYTYRDDTPSRSACVADWCVQDWPPLTVTRLPVLPTDLLDLRGHLGLLRRSDGTLQLTVAGHPVYRFAGDTAPGDVRGLGIGTDWYPLSPAGTKVTG